MRKPMSYALSIICFIICNFDFAHAYNMKSREDSAVDCIRLGYDSAPGTGEFADLYKDEFYISPDSSNGLTDTILCREPLKVRLQHASNRFRNGTSNALRTLVWAVFYAIPVIIIFGTRDLSYKIKHSTANAVEYFEELKTELGSEDYKRANEQMENRATPESLAWMKAKGPKSRQILEAYSLIY